MGSLKYSWLAGMGKLARANMVGQGTLFFLGLAVARTIGPEERGLLAIHLSLILLTKATTSLGVGQTLQIGASTADLKFRSLETRRALTGSALGGIALASAILAVTPANGWVAVASLAGVPSLTAGEIRRSSLLGLGHTDSAARFVISHLIARTVAVVGLLVIGFDGVAALVAASTVFPGIVAAASTARSVLSTVDGLCVGRSVDQRAAALVSEVSDVSALRGGILAFASTGSTAAVGAAAVGSSIGESFRLVARTIRPFAIRSTFGDRTSGAIIALGVAIVGVSISGCFFLVVPVVLGPAFSEHAAGLALVAAGTSVASANRVAGGLLVAARQAGVEAILQAGSVVAVIGFTLWLSPQSTLAYGVIVAASTVAWSAGIGWRLRQMPLATSAGGRA